MVRCCRGEDAGCQSGRSGDTPVRTPPWVRRFGALSTQRDGRTNHAPSMEGAVDSPWGHSRLSAPDRMQAAARTRPWRAASAAFAVACRAGVHTVLDLRGCGIAPQYSPRCGHSQAFSRHLTGCGTCEPFPFFFLPSQTSSRAVEIVKSCVCVLRRVVLRCLAVCCCGSVWAPRRVQRGGGVVEAHAATSSRCLPWRARSGRRATRPRARGGGSRPNADAMCPRCAHAHTQTHTPSDMLATLQKVAEAAIATDMTAAAAAIGGIIESNIAVWVATIGQAQAIGRFKWPQLRS